MKPRVRSREPQKLQMHLGWHMHRSEKLLQKRVLPQKAEVQDDRCVRDDGHLEPSRRRVSRSCASISSVKEGMRRM
jgi:hypothetical protein